MCLLFLLKHLLGIILHYYILFFKVDLLIIASHYLVETLNSIWIIAIFIWLVKSTHCPKNDEMTNVAIVEPRSDR
jgi:hypothetical protein